MKKIKKSNRNGERGTQLIEMAVCLPLLVLLAFLVIEGALFVRTHIVLNNAAREGAKAASLREGSCNNTSSSLTCQQFVSNAVVAYIQAEECGSNPWPCHSTPLIDTSKVSVTSTPSTVSYSEQLNGGPVTVQMGVTTVAVSYPYKFLWLPGWSGTTVSLQTNATFRNFY